MLTASGPLSCPLDVPKTHNLGRDEVGYILFGVEEDKIDKTGLIKGLTVPNWATDSNLQQKVRLHLNKTPSFSWSTLLVDNLQVGVIEIRGGGRPFYPLKDGKHLQRHVAQRRVGSQTEPASPQDIIDWFKADDLRRISDLEAERIEQDLKLLPRLLLFTSTLHGHNNRNLRQTVMLQNDGYALFSVVSAKCTWVVRVPNWFAPEQQTVLQPMIEEIPALTLDIATPNGTVKEGAFIPIEFSIKWGPIYGHFGPPLMAITEKTGVDVQLSPDLLWGTVSVQCRSPINHRMETANIAVRWNSGVE